MFYSTEILTSRKNGNFGLYWLAATLGSGSRGGASFKRISRKELLACDLVKACEKLASPDEPLALRLSSNLLCGIARVYQQQYSIYQADVTQMHQSIKKAFSEVYSNILVLPENDLLAVAIAAPAAANVVVAPAGPAGINLALEPGIALLGFDFFLGPADNHIDWDVIGGVEMEDVQYDLGEEGALQGLDDTPIHSPLQQQQKAAGGRAHQVRDLSDITLHEPRIEAYKMQGRDAADDVFGDEELFALPDDHPGILVGHSPEIDAILEAASAERSVDGSGSRRGTNWGGAAASSSAGAGAVGGYEDLGGFEDPNLNADFGGGEEVYGDVETMEERVRREHDEGAEQRAGNSGARASSVFGGVQMVDGAKDKSATPPPNRKKRDASPTPSEVAPVKSPSKKRKKVVFDKFISISDETAKEWREGYEERMDKEKALADKAKQDREGKQVGLDLIFGVPDFFGGGSRSIKGRPPVSSGLAGFYKQFILPTLTPLGSGKDVADRKRRKPSPHDDGENAGRSLVQNQDKGNVVATDAEMDPFNFDFNEFGGGDELMRGVGEVGMNLGGHDEFIFDNSMEDLEQGRAGSQGGLTGSQRNSMLPWNVNPGTSDIGYGNMDFGGGSSHGGTAKVSGDTPLGTGAKHRSRTGSLVPSVLGAGTLAGSMEKGDFGVDLIGDDLDAPKATDPEAALAHLEQESINFLSYAKRQADADPDSTLHFSDIVPVPSTNASTAATAFYHLLSLATKRHILLDQSEAYGEIEITFVS